MILFPALVVVVSLICFGLIARDWWRRPRPDKAAWALAFALFALAAGAEVVGAAAGWTPLLARTYYVSGAILVVGFLGLGELYLLAPDRIAKAGPGIGLFLAAVAVALVSGAPVDAARLATDGWHALERGPALVIFTIAVNTLGTLIVAGGAMYSAWQFRRKGIFRNRMIGCLLIAVGTLIVASGGTMTRLGRPEFLYIAMATGISIIGAGYLQTRRRDAVPATTPGTMTATAAGDLIADSAGPRLVTPALATGSLETETPDLGDAIAVAETAPLPATATDLPTPTLSPAVAFVSALMASEPAAIADRCDQWSVAPLPLTRLERGQARRVWACRLSLPTAAQRALDALPAATQVQVAELYFEVLLQPETQPAEAPSPVATDPERRGPVRLEPIAAANERTGN